VTEIIGIARRMPTWRPPRTQWVSLDVERDDLRPWFEGADAVIHLAWLIQPSRDAEELERVNVRGSARVFEMAAEAGVGALVHASSIGVYSPGPNDRPVDESWPREGVPSIFYSRHKVAAEKLLDGLSARYPDLRVVRLRPGLIFKRESGPEIRRLFAGPLLPTRLLRPGLLPVLPLPAGLVVQCVHSDDVGQAYRLAALSPSASGAYNIAADPVLDQAELGRVLRARPVTVPARPVRVLADLAFRAHLQPAPPGWLDMGLAVPTMSTERARSELGWTPRHTSEQALLELLEGMRTAVGAPTPPLEAHAGGRFRQDEVRSRAGARM
jgi:UDP-glucose 4-epimerase